MRSLKKLKERVDALGEGRSRRYSDTMKVELLDAVGVLRERGESWDRVADALGVSCETLRRWWHESRGDRGTRLVPVQVAHTSAGNVGVVVTPSGMRVEGLDVAAMAELLRALA